VELGLGTLTQVQKENPRDMFFILGPPVLERPGEKSEQGEPAGVWER